MIVLGDKNIFLALAGLIGIALLLDLFGFGITMGVFLFVTFKIFTESSWLKSALRAVITVIGLYVFFEFGLHSHPGLAFDCLSRRSQGALRSPNRLRRIPQPCEGSRPPSGHQGTFPVAT